MVYTCLLAHNACLAWSPSPGHCSISEFSLLGFGSYSKPSSTSHFNVNLVMLICPASKLLMAQNAFLGKLQIPQSDTQAFLSGSSQQAEVWESGFFTPLLWF